MFGFRDTRIGGRGAWIRRSLLPPLLLPLLCQAQEIDEEPQSVDPSVAVALERARVESSGLPSGGAGLSGQLEPTATARLRVRSAPALGDPLYRNGVAYYDEWTIRAGATRLRLPAYPHWRRVRPSAEFFEQQATSGRPGELLSAVIFDQRFREQARTPYVSSYALVWVPQQYAFSLMYPELFKIFKATLQEETVAARRDQVRREDFRAFEDYLNFKLGRDDQVGDLLDGYWIRAIDEEDLVVYFATSSFVYRTARTEIVDPMIMTVAYALVENKLLRIDMKRLYRGEDDLASLLAFSKHYVQDMRKLNRLSEEARTWR